MPSSIVNSNEVLMVLDREDMCCGVYAEGEVCTAPDCNHTHLTTVQG